MNNITLEMIRKKQELHGNIFVLQMYSMRDKDNGLYQFLLDGNFNVLLNKIYTDLEKINVVVVTIPDNVRSEDLEKFHQINECLFDGKIKLLPIPYDINAASNRDHFRNLGKDIYVRNFLRGLELINTDIYDLFICEFPLFYSDFEVYYKNIQYVWPMTAICAEDISKPYGKSINYEVEIITNQENTEVFYLSENQYAFVKSYIEKYLPEDVQIKNTYVSEKVVNKNFTILMSIEHELDGDTKYTLDKVYLDCVRFGIIFYPMRLEDVRYRFLDVLKIADLSGKKLVVTDPTNYGIRKFLEENEMFGNFDIIRIVNSNKRSTYFYFLSLLSESDEIWHYDDSIHLSIIEQLILTKAKIISPAFSKEYLMTYIN